jgi:hypothetical protein
MGDTPKEELYDLDADPWAVRNLADDPAHAATLATMRAEVKHWREFTGDRDIRPVPASSSCGLVCRLIAASNPGLSGVGNRSMVPPIRTRRQRPEAIRAPPACAPSAFPAAHPGVSCGGIGKCFSRKGVRLTTEKW